MKYKADIKYKNINAGWEVRDGRSICRWMLVWGNMSHTEIAGCAAGYSGGGTFQLEKFYLRYSRKEITFLQIDNEEKVSSSFLDFSIAVPNHIVDICEDCLDEILSWHDKDKWIDAENLCLLEEKYSNLSQDGDMLLFQTSDAQILIKVLDYLGITSRPLR